MYKTIYFFIILTAGCALRSWAQGFSVSESGSNVQVIWTIPDEAKPAPQIWADLRAMGFLSFLPPGNPDVPVMTIRIAIPAAGDYTYTWKDDPVAVEGAIPMQAMESDDVAAPTDAPTEAVEFAGEGRFRQVRYLAFHLYPLRMEDGNAVLSRTIAVSVQCDGAFGYAVQDHPEFESVYGRLFVNAWGDKGAAPGTVELTKGVSSYHPAIVAGSTAYKITVSAQGIYKLDYSFFTSRNIPTTNMNNLHIQNQGADVPFYWYDTAPVGTFSSGDAIYFYGVPYTAADNPALWQHGNYTNNNVYWVFVSATAGTQMATRSVTPVNLYTVPTQFTSSIPFEQNLLYTPFDPVLNDDLWLWMESSWYAGNSSPTNADHVVTVPSVATTLGNASLTFNLRGVSYDTAVNPDHQVTLSLNGNTLGTFTFNGLYPVTQTYTNIPMADLTQGTGSNTLRMAAGNPSTLGVPFEVVRSNNFTLTYQRKYEAYQNALTFYHTGDNWKFSVSNFSGPSTTYPVSGLDITTATAPVWLTNMASTTGTPYTVTLTDTDWSTQHTLYLAEATAPAGSAVTADVPSALDALNVNWILIGPSSWLSLSSVQNLQALREAQGYSTALVDIQDVYDEFNYGIMSPLAIQAFLSHVYYYSSPPDIMAVLLLGDGTFDYMNYGGFGSLNIVPTFMIHDNTGGSSTVPIAQYAWDDYYGCLSGGDILPDIYVGRIPAETTADVNNALAKIIGYAAPSSTAFLNSHLFAAGCRDGGTWDADQDANAAVVEPSTMTTQKIYFGLPPWNTSFTNCNTTDSNGDGINDVNQAFINALNAGLGTISYIGHGSFQFWDDNSILTNSNLALLTNTAKPAVFLNADCYTSAYFFQYGGDPSILQAALIYAGGSVASGGPGGFMYNFQSPYLTLPFYQDFFGLNKERTVGALLMQNVVTILNTGDARATKGYVKLGDMLTQVPLPAPAAPTGAQTGAACRSVTLSWTSPYTQFNIYRGASASGPWARIGTSATQSYTDSTGTYGNTYYYRMAAVDGSGNEGKGSAAVSVYLAPCAPQTPQGVACQNPQLGGRLTVSWTASSEPEVTGYIVKWGTTAGVYTQSESTGAVNTALITGLTDGTPYHFAVQAVNSFGLQSPLSADTACTSSHELGWAPPQMVYPLTLAKDTDGTPLLKWTLPASSIWGGSVSVQECSVYRSTIADHYPDRSDASPDRLAYVQASACTGGACAYREVTAPSEAFYMITCQTAKGEESPVETPPPAPLASVYEELDGESGCMYLGWTPVPYNMGGSSDTLQNYGVYRGLTSTFTPDVRNGTNRVGQDLWDYTDCPPDSQTYYYKVMGTDTKGNTGPY